MADVLEQRDSMIDELLKKVEAMKAIAAREHKAEGADKMYWKGVHDECKALIASPELLTPEQLAEAGSKILNAKIMRYKNGRFYVCTQIGHAVDTMMRRAGYANDTEALCSD